MKFKAIIFFDAVNKEDAIGILNDMEGIGFDLDSIKELKGVSI